MNRVLVGLIVFAAGFAIAQNSPSATLLIRNVAVIDCAGHTPQRGMSILISDGHIVAMSKASKLKAPANTEILDGDGKFLIPGLWNMHVHLGAYADGKRALADYLAEGVTGIRDMGSPLDDILRLRNEADQGTISGPHLVVAGPIVQGPLPFRMPMFISVRDVTAARQAVKMLKTRGVNFIKVQDAIPHDIYVAVAEESRNEHIPFAGHVPPTVLPEEASNLGQRSIEHLGGRFWGLLIGSSKRESELHAEEIQMYHDILTALDRKEPPSSANMRAAFTQAIVESYDSQKAAKLVSQFKRNDTWQCPTLVVLHTLWADGETQYSSEDRLWAERLIAKETGLVAMMQKAGVGLLAGTDLPPNVKGGTIHDELAALVSAGLTPMQALETATRNPAKFLGKLDSTGTIEPGKSADLLLLNANPLDDIRNTRRISAVILQGRVVPRPPEVAF
ncbi:MAG TPA: amidohydrolase family protein [Candidatus Angelobacter sp.]|nr:amidohydrolase family protein [Candidatus Angelobacter sp.]